MSMVVAPSSPHKREEVWIGFVSFFSNFLFSLSLSVCHYAILARALSFYLPFFKEFDLRCFCSLALLFLFNSFLFSGKCLHQMYWYCLWIGLSWFLVCHLPVSNLSNFWKDFNVSCLFLVVFSDQTNSLVFDAALRLLNDTSTACLLLITHTSWCSWTTSITDGQSGALVTFALWNCILLQHTSLFSL